MREAEIMKARVSEWVRERERRRERVEVEVEKKRNLNEEGKWIKIVLIGN